MISRGMENVIYLQEAQLDFSCSEWFLITNVGFSKCLVKWWASWLVSLDFALLRSVPGRVLKVWKEGQAFTRALPFVIAGSPREDNDYLPDPQQNWNPDFLMSSEQQFLKTVWHFSLSPSPLISMRSPSSVSVTFTLQHSFSIFFTSLPALIVRQL